MNEATYNSLMGSLAAKAAEAHALVVKGTDSRFKNPEFAAKNKKYIDPNRFYKEILEQLKNKYPRESTSESDLGDLAETKGEVVEKWLYDKGPSPTEYKANVEASKFIPILHGVADEGDDWYSMGNERLKRFASGLGWKVNTPEDYQKFLDKVGEYQQAFDRGKLSEELRDIPGYTLSSLFYPSVVEEIDNAVATGKGGETSDVVKLGILDALTNAGIFMGPSLGGLKFLPKNQAAKFILEPGISAASQAAAEAARQGGKEVFSETGQEFDLLPVATAASLGATVPGIVGSLQAAVSRIPGSGKLGRGISMARRTGNPVDIETSRVLENIDDFNNSPFLSQLLGEAPEVEAILTPAEAAKLDRIQGLNETFEQLFGVPATSKGIDKAAVVRNLDKPVVVRKTVGTQVKNAPKESVLLGENEADKIILDAETLPKYREKFPARYEDKIDDSKALKLGRVLGQLGLDIGGRVEPMIKVNPLNVIKDDDTSDYKKSDWYGKMSDNKKKLVDEAFKQKAMEREFEELVKQKPEAVRRAQMDIPDRDLKNPLTEKEYELVMAMRKRGFEKMLGGEQ
jgi:hypothetical protein